MYNNKEISLSACIKLPLEENVLLDVVEKAKDWALMHGGAYRSRSNFSTDSLSLAPFILLPSPFPRREFEKAVHLQTVLNELIHSIAYDYEFLEKTLETTIKVDEFTRNLFNIHKRVLEDGDAAQPISLGLLRCDMMLESKSTGIGDYCKRAYHGWKQIESNTFATGGWHLGPISSEIQRYVLQELNHGDKLVNLPANEAFSSLCEELVKVWNIYGNKNAIILFVTENIPYNICDQRLHEFYIRRKYPEVKVVRKTFTEIHQQGSLGKHKELIIDGVEVSVVYFRAGYVPNHYPTQNEWDARYLVEKSKAIKCPTINYQLAGSKKVQQVLAKPGILKRFITDEHKIKAITDIFAGLYSLDNDTDEGKKAYEMALEDSERYILKPEREGGGHNVYGKDIPDVLKGLSEVERSAWILMERILPPVTKGYLVIQNDPSPPPLVNLVSELGVYGAVISDKNKIVYNAHCGHVLRTKLENANEGGLAGGFGALDSPYLIEDEQ